MPSSLEIFRKKQLAEHKTFLNKSIKNHHDFLDSSSDLIPPINCDTNILDQNIDYDTNVFYGTGYLSHFVTHSDTGNAYFSDALDSKENYLLKEIKYAK